MRRPTAAVGSAMFFLVAPGTVVGLIPWLLTGWQVRVPVPYWAPMRVLGVILLVAAAGFVIQIVSGVDVPTVPPGLVIMLVAASLVAFLPWRWIPVVGAAVGLFLLVGFFASGAAGSLLDPSRSGVFIGAWIQFVAVIVAVVAGIVAIVQNYRSHTSL